MPNLPTAAATSRKDVEDPEKDPLDTPRSKSIYSVVATPTHRKLLLLVIVMATFLPSITNTIYVPALEAITQSLDASAAAVAATIAAYVAAEGLSIILCGTICDFVGRKPVYIMSTVVYIAAALGCAFAPNVVALTALRALQGVAGGAYPAAANGMRADAWPPSERGMATAIGYLPGMAGPVIGPLVGGFLSQRFGWRSIFFALAGYACLLLPAMLLLLTETHHYKVYTRLLKEAPDAIIEITEAEEIRQNPPKIRLPWAPLLMILERDTVLHVAVGLLTFSPGYAGLVLVSKRLAGPPYNWGSGLVGVALLAAGVGAIIAAPIGGSLFDRMSVRYPKSFMARLTWNNLAALVGGPAFYTLFALGLWEQRSLHPAVLVAALLLLGVTGCMVWPALMAYLTCVRQHAAASVTCGCLGVQGLFTASIVMISVPATAKMGSFGFFGLMGGLQLCAVVLARIQIHRQAAAASQIA